MSLYNEDELVPPIWINEEFFEKVLKKYEQNDKIKVLLHNYYRKSLTIYFSNKFRYPNSLFVQPV